MRKQILREVTWLGRERKQLSSRAKHKDTGLRSNEENMDKLVLIKQNIFNLKEHLFFFCPDI